MHIWAGFGCLGKSLRSIDQRRRLVACLRGLDVAFWILHRIREKLVIIVYMKGVSLALHCSVWGRFGLQSGSGICVYLQWSDTGYVNQATGFCNVKVLKGFSSL